MARRDFKKNVMSQQPWFVFTIILSVLLLAGCNLPRTKKAAPATQTPILPSKMAETWTPVVTPKLTDTFTPATLTPITLMVAPAGVKTEVLPAGEVQSSPPSGFRKLLVYPVGGMEGLTECDNSATAPVFQNAPPQIHALTQDFEENNFVTCGWKKDESVSITLTRPDGSQERTTQTYDGSTALAYSLAMAYGMQLGDYSLAFESPSGKVTHNFKVVWPTEPGMATTEGKKYFVYGFQPGEHVLVLAYQKSSDALRLSSWREITMDEHGELLLDDQFKDDLLAVAGDTSGPVWSSWMLGVFIDKNLYFEQVKPCSGAPAAASSRSALRR